MLIVDPTEASVENQNKRVTISDLDSRVSSVRYINTIYVGTTANSPKITSGVGTPENAVTATVGSLYLRTDGGAGTALYVKESGTSNTGWVAK